MSAKINLTGSVYGLLTVLTQASCNYRNKWVCKCECGVLCEVASKELRCGDTRSCGCLRKTLRIKNNTTHGASHTYTYKKWQGMHNRVRDTHREKNKCYIGMKVCKRWGMFENFLADMGEAPRGYSIDRINNKRGYSPSNSRWVPLAEQAGNTSRNRVVVFCNKRAHISAHARDANINPDIVFDRINKLGWTIEAALTTPPRKRCSHGYSA